MHHDRENCTDSENVLPMDKIHKQLSVKHADLLMFVGREKMTTQERILFNEMMTRSDVCFISSQKQNENFGPFALSLLPY